MNRADRKLWQSARTLDDLCELTAMWLEGELQQTPGHLGPPMPETAEITAELIAANRAGFLTWGSQPGEDWDLGWCQRAAVTGFVPESRIIAVRRALNIRGLWFIEAKAPRRRTDSGSAMVVTFGPDGPVTGFGHRIASKDLRWELGICHPDAVAQVCDAWQVTVIDPAPGRNDRLWPALAACAGTLAGGAS